MSNTEAGSDGAVPRGFVCDRCWQPTKRLTYKLLQNRKMMLCDGCLLAVQEQRTPTKTSASRVERVATKERAR